jgi:hypothetical protein
MACSSSTPAGGGGAPGSGGSLAFHGQVSPLAGFAYDTGLEPAASPAQVELKLSANGNITVDAAAGVAGTALVPKAGSGAIKIDLHFQIAGHLKVVSGLTNYDGDIPGMQNIDIAALGTGSFDPFLIGGATADVTAPIPAAQLPDIPLGTIPGKLQISIADGSTLQSSFRGTCLSVQKGMASYQGQTVTSGTLVLNATIALELPPPLNKSIPLPAITVTIPAATSGVDLGSQPAAGASDAQQGPCGPVSNTDGGMPPQDGSTPMDGGDAGADVQSNDAGDQVCVGDPQSCIGCCQSHHTAGATTYSNAGLACECGANGQCSAQCAASFCASPQTAPTPGDACDTCISASLAAGGACVAPVSNACSADPDCTAYLACTAQVGCTN